MWKLFTPYGGASGWMSECDGASFTMVLEKAIYILDAHEVSMSITTKFGRDAWAVSFDEVEYIIVKVS